MENIILSIICVLMQVGFLIFLNDNELLNHRIKKRFVLLTCCLFIELVFDNLALAFDGYSSSWVLPMKIIKAFVFSVAMCLPMIICNIIVRKNFWPRIKYFFYVIIGLNTICQFTSIFTSWMFSVDDNAVYHTTFGTWIYSAFLFIGLCLVVFSSLKTYVQNFNRFNSIIFIMIFIIAGFMLRVIYTHYVLDSLMLSITLYMFMLFFSNSFIKIDLMTALLNQTTYFSRLSQINYSTVIIEIDMNSFKYINDTFGHKKGDEVLSIVGEALLEVYGDIGYCFRRGGDEFAVIFKPRVLEKLSQVNGSSVYDEIIKYIEKLNKKIEKLSKKNNGILDAGLSQGYGIYYTYNDCFMKGEYKDVKEVVEIADERMFDDKKKKKGL